MSEINAQIKAIKDGKLILELEDDNQQISWPLNKIPADIEIGSTLKLILDAGFFPQMKTAALAVNGNTCSPDQNVVRRQQLLEDLIN